MGPFDLFQRLKPPRGSFIMTLEEIYAHKYLILLMNHANLKLHSLHDGMEMRKYCRVDLHRPTIL